MREAIAALAAILAAATPAAAGERADLVIRHVSIVDVASGRSRPHRAVAVRGGRIVAAGPDRAIGRRFAGARSYDGRGKFVMPGLWDMHVHFGGGAELIAENKALLPVYVAFGVTTVRDAAADIPESVLTWRSEIAAGRLLSPTIYTSGPKLEGIKPLWKGTIEVGSPAEVDAALDKLEAMHVDFVKITDNTLKPDVFLYALGAAKGRGLKTSAHTPFALTIEQAAAAGLSSVEHIDYLIKAGSPDEARIGADYAAGRISYGAASDRFVETFDAGHARRVYRRLAALGLNVTPTLNMGRILAFLDREDHSNDPALALIGPGLRQTYQWRVERAAKATPAEITARHREYDLSARVLPMLRDAGIPILAGTDAGYLNSFNYPGQAIHDELQRYVEAGLTPAQALGTATVTGPAFLGRAGDYGAVARGRIADLLILDSDPLEDIAATRSIRAVVLNGQLLDRAALDALLAEARTRAAN